MHGIIVSKDDDAKIKKRFDRLLEGGFFTSNDLHHAIAVLKSTNLVEKFLEPNFIGRNLCALSIPTTPSSFAYNMIHKIHFLISECEENYYTWSGFHFGPVRRVYSNLGFYINDIWDEVVSYDRADKKTKETLHINTMTRLYVLHMMEDIIKQLPLKEWADEYFKNKEEKK